MVMTIFRSRLRPEHAAEFQALADKMLAIAKAMPGFISYKSFRSEDGERCSVIEFDTAEHLRAWREHGEHRQVQQLGRARFYAEYSLYVAEPEREAHFKCEPAAPGILSQGR
jgi:heme-degrading monooxygenase HmoA